MTDHHARTGTSPRRRHRERKRHTAPVGGGYESVFTSVLEGYLEDGDEPRLAYSKAVTSTVRFSAGMAPGAGEGLRMRVAREVFEERGIEALRPKIPTGLHGAEPVRHDAAGRRIPRARAIPGEHPRRSGRR